MKPSRFDRVTTGCARFAGRPAMFVVCLGLSANGVLSFVYRDEVWIAGANLAISIVSMLLLPILQASTSKEGAAMQGKMDELIKANAAARNAFIGLEKRSEKEIEQLRVSCED